MTDKQAEEVRTMKAFIMDALDESNDPKRTHDLANAYGELYKISPSGVSANHCAGDVDKTIRWAKETVSMTGTHGHGTPSDHYQSQA